MKKVIYLSIRVTIYIYIQISAYRSNYISFYLSIYLSFYLSISMYVQSSDMMNCSWHVVAKGLCSIKCLSAIFAHEQQGSQNWCLSSCHSTACGHLEATTTSSVQSIKMLKDNILNACDFQQRLLLAHCSTRR